MRCPECAAEIADASRFCPQCGANLSGEAATSGGGASPGRAAGAADHGGKLRRGREPDVPEQEVWQGTYSPLAMLGTWLLVLLVTIGSGIAAAVLVMPSQYWGLLLIGWVSL